MALGILKRVSGEGDRKPRFTSRLCDEAARKVADLKAQRLGAEERVQQAEAAVATDSGEVDRERASRPNSPRRADPFTHLFYRSGTRSRA